MTRRGARRPLRLFADRAREAGGRPGGLRHPSPRAGFRPPRDERGAPDAGVARGAGLGERGVRRRSPGRSNWPILDPLAPHALAVARRRTRRGSPSRPGGCLTSSASVQSEGALRRGRAALSPRAAIDEASFGPDHPEVATPSTISRAASGHEPPRRGRAADAPRARDRRGELRAGPSECGDASTISRCCFRTPTASPRPSRSCAARWRSTRRASGRIIPMWRPPQQSRELLQDTNRLAEAEPLFRRALAIDEASFGPDHPNVATASTTRELLQDTNRLAEAEPLMRRALAIDEASFGPDHPDVAIRLNNLAALASATNRLAEAEPLYRRALAIDETSFGPDHPYVAMGPQQSGAAASGHEPPRRGRAADAPRARDRRSELRPGPSQRGDPSQQSRGPV